MNKRATMPDDEAFFESCRIGCAIVFIGWGARIRTWEWRNQKSSCHFDLTCLFSRPETKVLVLDQYVTGNFPTEGVPGRRDGTKWFAHIWKRPNG